MAIVFILLVAVFANAQSANSVPFPPKNAVSKIAQFEGDYFPMGIAGGAPSESCPKSVTIKKSAVASCFVVSAIANDGKSIPEQGLCLKNYSQELDPFGFWIGHPEAHFEKISVQNDAKYVIYDHQPPQTVVTRDEKAMGYGYVVHQLSTYVLLYDPSAENMGPDVYFSMRFSNTNGNSGTIVAQYSCSLIRGSRCPVGQYYTAGQCVAYKK